jgi:hypothetical protein
MVAMMAEMTVAKKAGAKVACLAVKLVGNWG